MLYLRFFINFFPDGNDAYSKLWTDHTAVVTSERAAPGTLMVTIDTNRMISFAISLGGFGESMLWTKLNTEAALLTPVYYHLNLIMF